MGCRGEGHAQGDAQVEDQGASPDTQVLQDAEADGGDTDNGASAGLVAFPGAEGFGASATGGRGGRVVVVTNLAASGPGSFQAALDLREPRTIVFATSGVIADVPILTHGDVTIAGQTSPGGITLRGLLIQGDEVCEESDCPLPREFPENFVIRHLRIRPAGIDDGDGAGDGLRLHHARRGILDHISIGNAQDEAVQIAFSSDITLQYSHFAETTGNHAEFGGMLINYSDPARGFPLTRLSIHHNMWSRIFGRLPEISRENVPDSGLMDLELSYNVLYDPERPIYLAAANPQNDAPLHYRLNMVGNYVAQDPALSASYGLLTIELGPSPQAMTALSSAFLDGNRHSRRPELGDYQLIYCCNDFVSAVPDGLPYPSPSSRPVWSRDARHDFPSISASPTGGALVAALARTVGAFPRDPMDRRLLSHPLNGTFDATPVDRNPANDALATGWDAPPPAPLDTDLDGMPDVWESERGLDPQVADGADTRLSLELLGVEGYTNLEVYLHERAVAVTR
jgi:hypothetical protein